MAAVLQRSCHNPPGSASSPPAGLTATWELSRCSAQDFIDPLWRSPLRQPPSLPMNHLGNCVVHGACLHCNGWNNGCTGRRGDGVFLHVTSGTLGSSPSLKVLVLSRRVWGIALPLLAGKAGTLTLVNLSDKRIDYSGNFPVHTGNIFTRWKTMNRRLRRCRKNKWVLELISVLPNAQKETQRDFLKDVSQWGRDYLEI